MVPLISKTVDEVSMAYIKEILPKTLCSKFILQDNGTEFKNDQLIKHTIATFIYGNVLQWDNTLPLVTYCYNVTL